MDKVRTDGAECAVLAAVAGFGLLGARWGQTAPEQAARWTVDAALLTMLGGGAIFAALFLAGHFALRRFGRTDSWLYGAAGAAAAIGAFLCFGGVRSIALAGDQGLVTVAIGLPLLAGWCLGAVYRRMAGLEHPAPRAAPADIEAAAVRACGHSPLPLASNAPDAPARLPHAPAATLIEAGEERYYDGPLQVRTSAALLAASGAAVGGFFAALVLLGAIAGAITTRDASALGMGMSVGAGASILLVLFFALFLFLPVWISHKVAQKFRVVTVGGYAGVGFATCIAVGILLPPFLVAAPFAAGAMALYRRWAGVEPVPLPGDIVVGDERALVGAGHAARRYRRVVRG
ncbi:MAG TPA: hypothetical protein VGB79_07750 [Allosphingosinicella sp.]|jgi:hypothetical protein